MTLQQLIQDLRCTHPRMKRAQDGEYPGIICYWWCEDCGYEGDSTTAHYSKSWAEEQQAWRDWIVESWLNEPRNKSQNWSLTSSQKSV